MGHPATRPRRISPPAAVLPHFFGGQVADVGVACGIRVAVLLSGGLAGVPEEVERGVKLQRVDVLSRVHHRTGVGDHFILGGAHGRSVVLVSFGGLVDIAIRQGLFGDVDGEGEGEELAGHGLGQSAARGGGGGIHG